MPNQYPDELEPIKIEGEIDPIGSNGQPDKELLDRVDKARKKLYPKIFKKIVDV